MKSSYRLNGLDHLRAFAIVSVFFYHYGAVFEHHPAWMATTSQFGWSGVDLFFVLSGYLIGGALLRTVADGRQIAIRDFYVQRFLRIIPVYWVVLTLYFLFPVLIERSHLPPLWRFLTFTQNFNLSPAEGLAFSQVWSLCVEEHFYLVFPLLLGALSVRKWGKQAFLFAGALIVLGCLLRAYCWTRVQAGEARWYGTIYYPTYTHLDGLIVGVTIAGIFTFCPGIRDWMKRYSSGLLVGGVTTLCLAALICANQESFSSSVFGFPLIALGFGALVVAALSPDCFLYRKASFITRTIAILSYSIYLVHKIVIHVIQGQAGRLRLNVDGTPMFFLCVIATLLTAWVLYIAIERPFMILRDRIYAKQTNATVMRAAKLTARR
jgi:peptidoglycan/LPS O-acetylase OafA/YrhL